MPIDFNKLDQIRQQRISQSALRPYSFSDYNYEAEATPIIQYTPEQIRSQQIQAERSAGQEQVAQELERQQSLESGGFFRDIYQSARGTIQAIDLEQDIQKAAVYENNQEKADQLRAIQKRVNEIRAESEKANTSGIFGEAAGLVGGIIDAAKESLGYAAAGAATGAAIGAIGGPFAGVTAVGGALKGASVGQFKYWMDQGGGSVYSRLRDEGIDHETARKVAMGAGPVYAAVEQVTRFLPKPLQSGLLRPFKETMDRSLTRAALKVAAKRVSDATLESAEEGVQQGIQDGAYLVASELTNGLNEEGNPLAQLTGDQVFKNMIDSGVQAFGPTMLLTGTLGGAEFRRARNQNAQVKELERRIGVDDATANQLLETATQEANVNPQVNPITGEPRPLFDRYVEKLNQYGQRQEAERQATIQAQANAEAERVAALNAVFETESRALFDTPNLTSDQIILSLNDIATRSGYNAELNSDGSVKTPAWKVAASKIYGDDSLLAEQIKIRNLAEAKEAFNQQMAQYEQTNPARAEEIRRDKTLRGLAVQRVYATYKAKLGDDVFSIDDLKGAIRENKTVEQLEAERLARFAPEETGAAESVQAAQTPAQQLDDEAKQAAAALRLAGNFDQEIASARSEELDQSVNYSSREDVLKRLASLSALEESYDSAGDFEAAEIVAERQRSIIARHLRATRAAKRQEAATKPPEQPPEAGPAIPTTTPTPTPTAPVAGVAATGQPAPAAAAPAAQVVQQVTLPRNLAGAKPRYFFGKKPFNLSFASDLDKALYIVAQTKPSAKDAQYLDFIIKSTGMTEQQARDAGRKIKESIKQQASTSDAETLQIPDSRVAMPPAAPAVVAKEQVKRTDYSKMSDKELDEAYKATLVGISIAPTKENKTFFENLRDEIAAEKAKRAAPAAPAPSAVSASVPTTPVVAPSGIQANVASQSSGQRPVEATAERVLIKPRAKEEFEVGVGDKLYIAKTKEQGEVVRIEKTLAGKPQAIIRTADGKEEKLVGGRAWRPIAEQEQIAENVAKARERIQNPDPVNDQALISVLPTSESDASLDNISAAIGLPKTQTRGLLRSLGFSASDRTDRVKIGSYKPTARQQDIEEGVEGAVESQVGDIEQLDLLRNVLRYNAIKDKPIGKRTEEEANLLPSLESEFVDARNTTDINKWLKLSQKDLVNEIRSREEALGISPEPAKEAKRPEDDIDDERLQTSATNNQPATKDNSAEYFDNVAKGIEGARFTKDTVNPDSVGLLQVGNKLIRIVIEDLGFTPSGQKKLGVVRRMSDGTYTIAIDRKNGNITTPRHELGHILFDSLTDGEKKAMQSVLGYDISSIGGQERFVIENLESDESRMALADRIMAAGTDQRGIIVRALNKVIRGLNSMLGLNIQEIGRGAKIDAITAAQLSNGLRDLSIIARNPDTQFMTTDNDLASSMTSRVGSSVKENEAEWVAGVRGVPKVDVVQERAQADTAQEPIMTYPEFERNFREGQDWKGAEGKAFISYHRARENKSQTLMQSYSKWVQSGGLNSIIEGNKLSDSVRKNWAGKVNTDAASRLNPLSVMSKAKGILRRYHQQFGMSIRTLARDVSPEFGDFVEQNLRPEVAQTFKMRAQELLDLEVSKKTRFNTEAERKAASQETEKLIERISTAEDVRTDLNGLLSTPQSFTAQEYYQILRYLQNEDSARAIMNNGLVVYAEDRPFTLRVKPVSGDKAARMAALKSWAESEMAARPDFAVFSRAQNKISDMMFPEINEVYKRLVPESEWPTKTGLKKEEFYTAMHRDVEPNASARNRNRLVMLLKSLGSIKEREKAASQPLRITNGLEDFYDTINRSAGFIANAEFATRARSLLSQAATERIAGTDGAKINPTSLGREIIKYRGQEFFENLLESIDQVEGTAYNLNAIEDSTINRMMKYIARGALTGPTTVAMQGMAFFIPLAKYSPDIVTEGYASAARGVTRDFLLNMARQSRYGGAILHRVANSLPIEEAQRINYKSKITRFNRAIDRLDRIGFAGMRYIDNASVFAHGRVAWAAVQRKMPTASDQEKADAFVKEWNDLLQYQMTGDPSMKVLSHNRGGFGAVLNMFRSTINSQYLKIYEQYQKAKQTGNKQDVNELIQRVGMTAISMTLYATAIRMGAEATRELFTDIFGDDEDKKRIAEQREYRETNKMRFAIKEMISGIAQQLPITTIGGSLVDGLTEYAILDRRSREKFMSANAAARVHPASSAVASIFNVTEALQRVQDALEANEENPSVKTRKQLNSALRALYKSSLEFSRYTPASTPIPIWSNFLSLDKALFNVEE